MPWKLANDMTQSPFPQFLSVAGTALPMWACVLVKGNYSIFLSGGQGHTLEGIHRI